MIWIICAIVSACLIALSIKVCLTKKRTSTRIIQLLLLLFAATFTAYLPIFLLNYELPASLIGNLVNVLHIIVIDADFMQVYDTITQNIGNAICVNLYIALLGILNIAMPAVSAFTALNVFRYYLSTARLRAANRHEKKMFVFSEFNSRSLAFAQSLSEINCDILFANSGGDSVPNNEYKRFIFKDEKITQLNIQPHKNKEIYFLCLSEDEDESLGYSLGLIEDFSKCNENIQKRIHIYSFSKYADHALYIDSTEKGLLDVQCINETELCIYNLLFNYPLLKYAKKKVHALLLGLTPINIAALKAICWCGQIDGIDLEISVIGKHISEQTDALKASAPGIFSARYKINIHNCETMCQITETVGKICKDVNYVIVSEDTDNETLKSGVLLRRLIYRADERKENCPPIFCHINEESKHTVTFNLCTPEINIAKRINYKLIPFGGISEVYNYKALSDSKVDNLSKNVHLAYEEIFSNEEIDINAALRRYNLFEVNKRSNRANALHIKYKLNLLGLDFVDDDGVPGIELKRALNDCSLHKLAISEHNRWMAFLETEGWIQATEEDVNAYLKSGISANRHNCPMLKMHPYICEYERLKDLSIKLEGKDTTLYDEELITRIPDILADKWHISGHKYKIVKL